MHGYSRDMKLKLQQGQMWKKGDMLVRIVHLERLSVGYKDIKNHETKEGEHHTVTKKEFCRLIKGAELQPAGEARE